MINEKKNKIVCNFPGDVTFTRIKSNTKTVKN